MSLIVHHPSYCSRHVNADKERFSMPKIDPTELIGRAFRMEQMVSDS